jgi:outer membrane lipoprotein-sorting protein
MRRLASLIFLAAAAIVTCGAGQAPPPRLPAFSDQDRADLDRVSAYLNAMHTLRGSFVQIGPNGEIDQGRFYLQKPGKLRFEYNPPSPILIVSDGRTVAVSNSKLKTVDRYPLSTTPLDLILGDKVDLRHDSAIVAVAHQGSTIIVEARTSRNRSKPNIAITFSESPLELRQWTVIDDQGQSTTVALRELEQGVAMNDSLFVLRDARKPVGAKERD